MRHLCHLALLATLALAVGSPAHASRTTERSVTYRFTPTNQVGSTSPTLQQPIGTVPARVEVVDGRSEGRRDVLGTWTTGDDRVLPLPLAQDMLPELGRAVALEGASWGIPMVEGEADRVFTLTLMQASVSELNKAVGATYRGTLTLQGALLDRDGRQIWSGSSTGDASRYGRAASDANVCEVLSDALVEAWAALLGSQTLQAAWVSGVPSGSAASPPPPPGG